MNNPLDDLFIHQTFSHHALEKSKFAKHSPCQTFPLYGSSYLKVTSILLTDTDNSVSDRRESTKN